MTELTHAFEAAMPVTPTRLFQALTDPAELAGWFAEHADIDPAAGRFRFWGRSSYSTPTAAEADQVLSRFEPGKGLTFSWTVQGQPSQVDWRIEGDPKTAGDAIWKVRHHFPVAPAIGRAKSLITDLWSFHTGALKTHLIGQPVDLPDFTDPAPRVRQSIFVAAPRERVFQALIDPEILNRWIASAARVEPRVGGEMSYGWEYKVDGRPVTGGPTRILELVPNEKLVTDWPDWRLEPGAPVTTVSWTLTDEAGGTRVTLTHGTFERPADIGDYPYGWQDFLVALARLFAAGGEAA
ncbi:uncharacterized protein YndB with AHSA1/START domain [Caulobacter ginsengisoli]|uniref:Uncharacterized protein YndB with AHSA1/START domain n=1 Tax=Caulobacter ginsengisoli TaxID=400775 RepID=A0ABU0J0N0_9CAUL|nr:SRPBCC family protein [Caulobacter ginsengisoli]MDQ0466772.1 uncharacterized protein YndB with AHSA1/START domain [Caulobacter ginsengisoli]